MILGSQTMTNEQWIAEAMRLTEAYGHDMWLLSGLPGSAPAAAIVASREALRAHLATVPSVPEWLPIETAPRDGRKLILFYLNRNNKSRTVMARWVTDEEAAETDADDVGLEGGWYECIDNWDDYCQIAIHEGEPTHWMPLPAAPKQENQHD